MNPVNGSKNLLTAKVPLHSSQKTNLKSTATVLFQFVIKKPCRFVTPAGPVTLTSIFGKKAACKLSPYNSRLLPLPYIINEKKPHPTI